MTKLYFDTWHFLIKNLKKLNLKKTTNWVDKWQNPNLICDNNFFLKNVKTK